VNTTLILTTMQVMVDAWTEWDHVCCQSLHSQQSPTCVHHNHESEIETLSECHHSVDASALEMERLFRGRISDVLECIPCHHSKTSVQGWHWMPKSHSDDNQHSGTVDGDLKHSHSPTIMTQCTSPIQGKSTKTETFINYYSGIFIGYPYC